MLHAVLTGDIINSTKIEPASRSRLITLWLQEALPHHPFEISRGDTFQLRTTAADALRISIDIRAVLRRQQLPGQRYQPDARISIGIGTVAFDDGSVSTSTGEAFEYSGRGLEMLKEQTGQIQLFSPNTEFNLACNTSLTLLEWLVQHWSRPQAVAIHYMLHNYTQRSIAEIEKVSQPAIQQRLKTAGWPAIESLLSYYDTAIKPLVI